ncbi:MAG TPA: diguanylate cyclase [Burkholderiales bacterium]|nr:diguanylate cyclase [Burkholderiales bacterium]
MATILAVDDHRPTLERLGALFTARGHRVILASDARMALDFAAGELPDLVVTDVVMPGMDGFTLVRELRKRPRCKGIRVIMMSAALHDRRARSLAAGCGALTFIAKPFEPQELLAEAESLCAGGEAAAAPGSDPDLTASHRAFLTDTLAGKMRDLESLNRRLEEKVAARARELAAANALLQEQANRDALTGLYNRRYLDDTLPRELQRCRRAGRPLALLMIDLDHFKRVNDQHGHDAGDAVLRHVGKSLAGSLQSEDIACRYGGEEFTLVLPGAELGIALERLHALREQVRPAPIVPAGAPLSINLSAGLAMFPEHGCSPDMVVRAADEALYRAKEAGRNCVAVAN